MTIDVNQQFNDQRAAAVQRFGSVRRDDGTWTGTGFDANEVIGRDGLDTTLGEAALYTSTPAWHGLGNVIPGGTDNIDDVLRLGGIAYGVEKRNVRYSFMGDGETTPSLRTAADYHVTVRTDTGAALGVVGSKYEVIQNRDLFVFLQDLVADHGVIWESAGALRGGKRVFVTMRLPESVRIDEQGIDDEIVPFVVMLNGHDGRSPAQALVTPWRVVCANTERFAVRDAHSTWKVRHTASAMDRIAEARRTLGLTVEYYEEWAAEETLLAQTEITMRDVEKLIADLWPVKDDAPVRTRNAATRRSEQLADMYRAESERLGRTAYAAERAITDYLDHIAPRRPGKTMTEEIARATALLEGSDDDIKTTAHKRLMTLVRR
jgi:phage/plasmid-like protein (TIGR03299 family)